jgi:hypothetical protein
METGKGFTWIAVWDPRSGARNGATSVSPPTREVTASGEVGRRFASP